MFKKFLSILLATFMLLLCVPIMSFAAENSCGDNVTWNYDLTTETVTISGTGETYNYSSENPVPWSSYSVKNVVVESGITTVGDYFFTKGSNIELSETVVVNSATFASAENIEKVSFSKNNANYTILNDVLFTSDMTKLVYFPAKKNVKTYNVPVGITTIGEHAFNRAYYLSEVILPDSITTIGNYAFDHARIKSINLPEGLTYLGSYAFNYCGNLNNVVIPASLTVINDHTFFLCDDLVNLTFSDGLMIICDYAFANCHKLESVMLPDSLMILGNGAFEICENLTEVILNDNLASIGKYAFAACSNLTYITVPGSVGIIEEAAFYECTKLSSIILEDGVFGIGMLTFANCPSLTEITLPETIAEIDVATFMGDNNLKNLYILNKEAVVKTLSNRVTIPTTTTVHGYCAPESVLENYKWFIENENNNETEKKEYHTLYQFVTKNNNNFVSLDHICNEEELTCSVCNKEINNEINIENIETNKKEITLFVGESTTLTTIVTPENASNKTLKYASSNNNVVTVDENGKIVAKNPGTAAIKIAAASGITTSVKVIVKPVLVSSISATIGKANLVVGEITKISTKVFPENAYNKEIAYTTSDNKVVKVDKFGNVEAVNEGNATITIKALDGSNTYTTINITVTLPATNIPVETISLEVDKNVLSVGETAILTAYVTPEDATNKRLVCTSSDISVIKIGSAGTLIAVNPGIAIITVTSDSGVTASITITVNKVPVSSISAKAGRNTLSVGNTTTISTTINPSNATYKNVTYKSSDENIVKVDSQGKVTAVGIGSATITITSVDDTTKTTSITITVKEKSTEDRCSMCNSYEANIGTPMEFFYMIIHVIVHFFETLFA